MTSATLIIILLIAVAIAITASLTWLVDRNASVRRTIVRLATDARGWDGGDIPVSAGILIGTFLVGLLLGLWTYTDRVHAFQAGLVRAYCSRDVISTLLAAEPEAVSTVGASGAAAAATAQTGAGHCTADWHPALDKSAPKLTPRSLYTVLRRLGLLSRDEIRAGPKGLRTEPGASPDGGTPNRAVAIAVNGPDYGNSFSRHYLLGAPTIDLVIALGEGGPSKLELPSYELPWTRAALAGLLARAPADWGWEPALRRPPQPPRCQAGTPDEECVAQAKTHLRDLKVPLDRGLIMRLPEEITAYQATALLDNWIGTRAPVAPRPDSVTDGDALASQEAIPRLQAALLDALRDDDVVRKWRMYLNAMVGPERALILVLAFWFIALTVVRALQSLPHRAHLIEIRAQLKTLDASWQPLPPVATRWQAAKSLLQKLTPRAVNGAMLATIPSTLLEAAVGEMACRQNPAGAGAAASPQDARAIETAAEGLRGKIGHSRLIFEALLPTFPAIGFVGTVTSLLVAMSKADQIVKATDPLARGMATAAVTDTLSLCFAATFMALLCLIVLAPLSLWQTAQEQRLVSDTEHLLQDVLRPEQP